MYIILTSLLLLLFWIVAPPSPAESMNSKLMESTDDTQAAERSLVQKERAQKAKYVLCAGNNAGALISILCG